MSLFSSISKRLSRRQGIDRAIWLALLSVLGTTIFSTALLQISLGVLAILWLTNLVRGPANSFRSTGLDLPMLLFIVGRILSIPFSVHPESSVAALHIEIIFYAAFFVFTNVVRVDHKAEMTILLQMFMVTALMAALIGIFKYATGLSPRASSSTSGTYTLGLYLVSTLPIALLLTGKYRLLGNVASGNIATGILCLGIILTFDRLHWVAMAATFFATAFIIKDKRPLVTFLLGMATMIIIVPSVAQRFQATMTLFSHMSYRDVLWRGATLICLEHPVTGFGPRTFREIFPFMSELGDRKIGSWHNDYLQVYMESGLVALIPMVWLVVSVFSSSFKALRSEQLSPERQEVLITFLVSVSIFAIAGGMLDTLMGIVFRFDLAVIALIVAGSGNEASHGTTIRT